MAVSGERTLRELTEMADRRVRRALERASGVGEVAVVGGLERAINIWIDADRLAAYRLPIGEVRAALASQNADLPGGNITSPTTNRHSGRSVESRIRATSTIS